MKPFALVNANPYPWPFDAAATPANTALVIIDMQFDFIGIGGYVDRMGYDLSMTRAPIGPILISATAVKRSSASFSRLWQPGMH